MSKKQTLRLQEHFEAGNTITSLGAYTLLGITQLSARLKELEETGFLLNREWIKVQNRFGEDCHVKEYSIATDLKVAA